MSALPHWSRSIFGTLLMICFHGFVHSRRQREEIDRPKNENLRLKNEMLNAKVELTHANAKLVVFWTKLKKRTKIHQQLMSRLNDLQWKQQMRVKPNSSWQLNPAGEKCPFKPGKHHFHISRRPRYLCGIAQTSWEGQDRFQLSKATYEVDILLKNKWQDSKKIKKWFKEMKKYISPSQSCERKTIWSEYLSPQINPLIHIRLHSLYLAPTSRLIDVSCDTWIRLLKLAAIVDE